MMNVVVNSSNIYKWTVNIGDSIYTQYIRGKGMKYSPISTLENGRMGRDMAEDKRLEYIMIGINSTNSVSVITLMVEWEYMGRG